MTYYFTGELPIILQKEIVSFKIKKNSVVDTIM
jgi:hypothetical protein